MTRICKRCGKEFSTEKNAQKFCSPKCAKTNLYFSKKQTEFKCAYCGKTFTSENKKKYCSENCRLIANGRRNPQQKKRKQKNFMSIEEVARASREMNMSAGEYMVKYCYGKE